MKTVLVIGYGSIGKRHVQNLLNVPNTEIINADLGNFEKSLIEKFKGEIDVVIGGPPCQSFSSLGRAKDENGMQDDPRNYLFESYEKILNHFKPKIFVFENVTGLLTAKLGKEKTVNVILKKLGQEYKLIKSPNDMVLNSCDYGVPQVRKRIILIGVRKDSHHTDRINLHESSMGILHEFNNFWMEEIEPKLMNKVIFVTYPFFDAIKRKEMITSLSKTSLDDNLESLRSMWEFTVSDRAEGVPLDRALSNFRDQLQSIENGWFGFHSMFHYPSEERLPLSKVSSLVLNDQSSLTEPTSQAYKILTNAQYKELEKTKGAIFELNTDQIIHHIESFILS